MLVVGKLPLLTTGAFTDSSMAWFSVNGDLSVTEELDAIRDNEKKWYAWSKIECVKRYELSYPCKNNPNIM